MFKRFTRIGNRVALVLDEQLLEAADLDPDEPVEVSTNGHLIVIAPARTKGEMEKLGKAQEKMHAKYAGAFARLAK